MCCARERLSEPWSQRKGRAHSPRTGGSGCSPELPQVLCVPSLTRCSATKRWALRAPLRDSLGRCLCARSHPCGVPSYRSASPPGQPGTHQLARPGGRIWRHLSINRTGPEESPECTSQACAVWWRGFSYSHCYSLPHFPVVLSWEKRISDKKGY